MLDLKLLTTFREVAVRRSFSDAATALSFTQPAISQHVARLEAMVGTDERIKLVAQDLVDHVEKRFGAMEGKAMIVTMSRDIAARLYAEIRQLRPAWHDDDDNE